MFSALQGQTALVTGGSRGIGRSIALALAEYGVKVAVNYSGSEAAAQETVARIAELGSEGIALKGNVGSSEQAENLVKEVINTWGRIDILVNNAGITRDNLIMRMKEEEFDQVIETNLKGVFNCLKAVTRPMMKQRYGRIINISSVVGVTGNPGQVNYTAAKAGVIGMTKSAARELASRGITVNCIAPGFIDTDMTRELSDEVRSELLKGIPLAQLGRPEDIANTAVFLASQGAAYMTGQTLHVDGGMYM
ncbi:MULTISPECIES: 3-oxoacyl-[acyl-carrier-protein] reductase [unclassified Paenibacillus]|uniref:3-oxoacyl-[acyl-carrier-protein] reductase n=1 Tax=unclassified Paenibacillus TaxID=185978 RepID=UPI0024061965|nr:MULTISPECIES: 3-oxoacyl-[acyl-carrier-protein] reductase [unclassified Paenibacillus]MDF9839107.1 3-oxoacyl-[acyl-carrier protein] reductase [Paenibacillus sp. PastF-2]MDF9845689.1 3-oxoacyl-[acyl-carrier protein] reductase [Paenibacillus sp. PastM-2]MDF9852261.1 3-oxoacyl-[acyl-carrier protein] reductase [Paenibacillus sp. PastF-1]MDH6478010.1 3-oxoacyl-[acyl-carrier protein] reductase [Paenibacillus sp. PastH-2]MDH6505745.1 3-oxoacyl-[acyl-carrier protein] reductase [Paenibacillus sp. Pas